MDARLAQIRERVSMEYARPAADGNYYDGHSQAVADRAYLLAEVDRLQWQVDHYVEQNSGMTVPRESDVTLIVAAPAFRRRLDGMLAAMGMHLVQMTDTVGLPTFCPTPDDDRM